MMETRIAPVHLSGYQARDYEIVDYEMYRLGDTGLSFRGPAPATLDPGSYFACIGAAQTLGCFCQRPFPDLLADELGLPALNLGYGGAGPEFFATQEALLPYLNNARFVVLQVMSARSQSNSYYQCDGLEYVTLRESGQKMGAAAAFTKLLAGSPRIAGLPGWPRGWRKLAALAARPEARRIVDEIRTAWVESSLQLLEKITVPVVLLWISKRPPAYTESYATAHRLFGEFPHLVTPEMLAPIRERSAAYVECITSRGSPQPLFSRFTGEPVSVNPSNDRPDLAVKPWTENGYYPSPEMHEDAAAQLEAFCRDLLDM